MYCNSLAAAIKILTDAAAGTGEDFRRQFTPSLCMTSLSYESSLLFSVLSILIRLVRQHPSRPNRRLPVGQLVHHCECFRLYEPLHLLLRSLVPLFLVNRPVNTCFCHRGSIYLANRTTRQSKLRLPLSFFSGGQGGLVGVVDNARQEQYMSTLKSSSTSFVCFRSGTLGGSPSIHGLRQANNRDTHRNRRPRCLAQNQSPGYASPRQPGGRSKNSTQVPHHDSRSRFSSDTEGSPDYFSSTAYALLPWAIQWHSHQPHRHLYRHFHCHRSRSCWSRCCCCWTHCCCYRSC